MTAHGASHRPDLDLREQVGRMCSAISHRGPDDQGIHLDGGVCLGQRRLSVIDLDNGHQPMTSAASGNVIVFNGEVYNFRELREELRGRGHAFETNTDTEVVLKAYDEYGEGFVEHLRGMFAVAVWDPAHKRLLLVRDRAGIKPIYYALDGGLVAFGSELKALTVTGLLPTRLDPAALDDYLAYGFIGGSRTIYRATRKLEPGHMLRVDLAGRQPQVSKRCYWALPDADSSFTGSFEDAQLELQRQIDDAVRIRLVADVPLGAFLSGGIDSSTVVWSMARQQSAPVKTFSMAFSASEFDESPIARKVAEHFGCEHHEELVAPDAIEALPFVIAGHDEPFADPSSIPVWYLCRLARKGVTVCLSGDGGDELFAGYSRYATLQREAELRSKLPGAARWALETFARGVAPERRRHSLLARLGSSDSEQHYARFRAVFSEAARRRLYSSELRATVDQDQTARLFAPLSEVMRSHPDPIARFQAADFSCYLPEDVLTKVDRMSMAHSLEVRVPLLDPSLVAFAQSLPGHYKFQRHTGGFTSKKILRALIAKHLPREVLEHPKRGFSVPLRSWMRGRLSSLVSDTLRGPVLRERGWFSARYFDRLHRLWVQDKVDLGFQLWSLIILRTWLEAHPGITLGDG